MDQIDRFGIPEGPLDTEGIVMKTLFTAIAMIMCGLALFGLLLEIRWLTIGGGLVCVGLVWAWHFWGWKR